MASGTAASRITGQLRTILLAAAVGTTGIAANAYQAGSMIPQVIYTLVSGGIFNAVLVPQIVRTLKHKDAERRLNALITFAVVLLAGVTLLMMLATPLLSRLYVNGSEGMIALTNAFTLWCMPQIFFYGLYTVIGQILAAKNHFVTYAWSSVGANVISCLGFIAFIAMFGHTNEESLAFWTPDKVALTAGAWTLGVAFQALVLFIPLVRIGIRYRWHWDIHGIGLRSMGPVAAWSLLIVVIDQIANVLSTRMTTSAPHVAQETMHLSQLDVAGNATYQNAYTIYMLPYSLIAVSVATAVFPLISNAVAEHNIAAAREELSNSLRNVGLLMFFFTAAFIVMPLPMIRALLPSVPVPQAILITGPLMALALALPFASAYLIIQRTFYAFEDGRSPFLFMALMLTLQLTAMYIGQALLPPTHWVTVLGLSGSIGYILSFIPLVIMLRKRFNGNLDGKRIALTYGKSFVAMCAAIVVGLSLTNPIYHLLGIHLDGGNGSMSWFQAIIACCLFGIVLLVIYVVMLWALRCDELASVRAMLLRRIGKGAKATEQATEINGIPDADQQVGDVPIEPAQDPAPENELDARQEHDTGSLAGRISAEGNEGRLNVTNATTAAKPDPGQAVHPTRPQGEAEDTMKPHLGDTVLNRYTLVSPLREEPGLQAWKASDRVLSQDCQLFLVNNAAVLPGTNALAGFLARTRDPRFTPVLQLQHVGRIALVVTQLDPGLSISEYVSKPDTPLSYEGMRTVIAEACTALRYLHKQHLTHSAISTDTVRVTRNGVQIADAPVCSALADTSGSQPGITDEQLSVNQLADVLYGMLTRTPSMASLGQRSLSKLPAGCPDEFAVICKRGLNLSQDGTPTVPLLTLTELELLLGPHKPWHSLTREDLHVSSHDGACSIVRAAMKPAMPAEILPLPDDIASSQTLPQLDFGDTPLPDPAEIEARREEQRKAQEQAAAADNSFRALWATSKALMNGTGDGEESSGDEVSPRDATEMFSAFTDATDTYAPMQPNRMTTPMDVSALRHGRHSLESLAGTGEMESVDQTVVAGSASAMRNAGVTGAVGVADAAGVAGAAGVVGAADTADMADMADMADTNGTATRLSAGIVGAGAGIAGAGAASGVSDAALGNTTHMDPIRTDAARTSAGAQVSGQPPAGTPNATAPSELTPAPVALPPSFAPKSRMTPKKQEKPQENAAKRKKAKSPVGGRVIAIVAAVLALGLAIGFGVHALTTGRVPFRTEEGNNPWPTWNSDDVPFGDRSGAEVPQNNDQRASSPTPTPSQTTQEPENTTAYPVASQQFLDRPDGQQGFGYYLRLDAPHKVSKVVITIKSSGGHGQIIVNSPGNPTQGQQAADFTFADGGTTEVKLNKAVDTQDVLLWVPIDSLPGGQLYIESMQVF
ncbi:putative integral membrane protein MviN [Bifidobacterium gallicum DSM 20093 = LMG 11596]|nr:putative integral membrane protein MviN [Bifidobacterium gallicum DSM 20093 = LMG 11596]